MKASRLIAYAVAAAGLLIALPACNTSTTDQSYEMAERGHTRLEYSGFFIPDAKLRECVLAALAERHWIVSEASGTIKARIERGEQMAVAAIDVKDGVVSIETKGSKISGTPYVPMRYIDFLMKSVRKNAAAAAKASGA